MRWSGTSRARSSFLSHEGRQHAVRYVGGEDDGVTSVEVVTNGTLGGKVVFPDERTSGRLAGTSGARRSCFAGARLRTSSTRRRRRSGRRWSTSSDWTRSRAFAKICSARETTFARNRRPPRRRPEPIVALSRRGPRTSVRKPFSRTSSRSAGCSASIRRDLSIRSSTRRG